MTSCALGVIPLGSGNDLAGTLGIPPDLEVAVDRAVRGEIRRIDPARIGETFSVSYAGVGFDSEVTRYANETKILRGPLIYFYAVIHTLITFVPPRMRVVHDGGEFEGKVMFAVVNNLPRFGGGMRIAPDARIDDGLLDLVIVKEVPKPVLLVDLPQGLQRQARRPPGGDPRSHPAGRDHDRPRDDPVRRRRAPAADSRGGAGDGGGSAGRAGGGGLKRNQGPRGLQGLQGLPGTGLVSLESLSSLSLVQSYPTLNSTPCASGSSVPQLIVQVWRRM